jgi:hypothetical protein
VQRTLQVQPLADVAHVHHEGRHLGHGTLVGDRRLGVAPQLGAVPQPGADQRRRPVGMLAGQHRVDHRLGLGHVVGVDQVAELAPDHLVVGEAEQPGRGRRLPSDPQPLVEDQGEVGGPGHQRSEVRLGGLQLAGVPPDVAHHEQLARDQHGHHADAEDDAEVVELAHRDQVPERGDHTDGGGTASSG